MENFNNLEEKKTKLNIGFFFLCLGLLITLITSVVSLLNLIFSTLDKKFPDVLNATYQYGYSTYDYENIRVALATLIIFFPIFLVIAYFWKKYLKNEIGKMDETIKKWLIYIILFLSSIIIAIDLAILVRYFISGEITQRFIYKIFATLITALIIGKYFYVSEFWNGKEVIKKLNSIINPIAGIVLVFFAIFYSFSVMGSPTKQRLLRLDDKRVNDLQSIQYQIINYWQQKEKLPIELNELSNPMTGFYLPMPPTFEKGEKYEYFIKNDKKLTFELCATFSLPMPRGWQESGNYYRTEVFPMMNKDFAVSSPVPYGGVNESWNHDIGRTCFERTIDKDIYPPFSKTLK